MRKKLVVVSGLLIVAVAGWFVWARDEGSKHPKHPKHPKPQVSNQHAAGIDRGNLAAAVLTLLNAPDGATPCETAYNAIEAEGAAARLANRPSIFKWVAPKVEFLAACQQLAPVAQNCLMPRYRRDHDAECAAAEPASEVLSKLYVLAQSDEQQQLGHQ